MKFVELNFHIYRHISQKCDSFTSTIIIECVNVIQYSFELREPIELLHCMI